MADIFAGRVAIVTGGARGIGGAITRALAEQGAHVAAGYSKNRETAERFRQEMAEQGHSVSIHHGNVGLPEDCERVAREVLEERGQVDVLVNNAGITVDKTVRKMTVEDWHAVLRINLSGAFYMTKAVLEHMLGRGYGRIVNISSVIGETGNIGQANYAASKSGLFGLTKSLAREACFQLARAGRLGEDSIGVTVNTVAPGFIGTEMLSTIPEKVLDRIRAQIP